MIFYFLSSILKPSYSLTSKLLDLLQEKKRPQLEETSLALLGSIPFIALDSHVIFRIYTEQSSLYGSAIS